MPASIQHLAKAIKTARRRKGLSQRALSEKVGIPQGHISKIENGMVDVQASSLVELARALDLEVMLAPRQLLPVIEGLGQNPSTAAPPAYRLGEHGGHD